MTIIKNLYKYTIVDGGNCSQCSNWIDDGDLIWLFDEHNDGTVQEVFCWNKNCVDIFFKKEITTIISNEFGSAYTLEENQLVQIPLSNVDELLYDQSGWIDFQFLSNEESTKLKTIQNKLIQLEKSYNL